VTKQILNAFNVLNAAKIHFLPFQTIELLAFHWAFTNKHTVLTNAVFSKQLALTFHETLSWRWLVYAV